jgi:uncharacterized protein YkwD
MRFLRVGISLTFAAASLIGVAARAQSSSVSGGDLELESRQLFALANQARAQAGVGALEWDEALAAAALQHCERMAREGPIAHRYGGEPDVGARAAAAGAHFSVIEENVAVGPSAAAIHDEWMHSPGHRENLLSADVDRVGIAVVEARGVLYAVQDFSRGVQQLDAAQVEVRVAALMHASGVAILDNHALAREACATEEGVPHAPGGMMPRFIMRWQAADLTQLPQALAQKLASGNYRQAAVGSCPAQTGENSFSAYRVAVLLY